MARVWTLDAGQGKVDVVEATGKTVTGDIGVVIDWTKFSENTSDAIASLELIRNALINADTSLT